MKLRKPLSKEQSAPEVKPTIIGPASKKQELFLNSDAMITLAGGAAGLNLAP